MKKLLLVFGTRPEAIKMAPLIFALKEEKQCFDLKICVTAQHRQMLDQVLDFFNIKPDYDLDLMKSNQSLYSITSDILLGLKPILEKENPDFVFVHGDTVTSMATALAAYYNNSRVCHVEAGLRTWNKWSPFPEEMNRQLTARLTDIHFAPTENAKDNLIGEGIDKSKIYITGNTVIDALQISLDKVNHISYSNVEIEQLKQKLRDDRDLILVTGHRRENFGEGFIHICSALKQLAENRPHIDIVYPVHLNPNVQEPVNKVLNGIDNIKLISPLSYPAFVWLMNKATLIITDSGGIQEEAPSLGKPVLVTRDTTERPEAVKAGTVILTGTKKEKIVNEAERLLSDKELYNKMSQLHNPYGDGRACRRIVEILKRI